MLLAINLLLVRIRQAVEIVAKSLFQTHSYCRLDIQTHDHSIIVTVKWRSIPLNHMEDSWLFSTDGGKAKDRASP